jgi:serine/threonine protein kinase
MPQPLSPVSGNRQKAPPPTTAATATNPVDSKYAPPPPGEISDGTRTYEVGPKLGRGGFAMCYEAKVQSSGESVALKVVKTQMARKVEEKFRTELQIHSKLRHRHIAEFVRAFTREERTFIVLELCSRGSLKEMLTHRKSLSSPEVRRFGVQILGALSYMHSRSIVHRDLKMANIFLDGNMEPKIGDFGLAAVLLSDDQMGVIRRTTLCGTPNYIAPEVLSKSQGHDTKADIWSFGVLM